MSLIGAAELSMTAQVPSAFSTSSSLSLTTSPFRNALASGISNSVMRTPLPGRYTRKKGQIGEVLGTCVLSQIVEHKLVPEDYLTADVCHRDAHRQSVEDGLKTRTFPLHLLLHQLLSAMSLNTMATRRFISSPRRDA
jgi:hypothetical protein